MRAFGAHTELGQVPHLGQVVLLLSRHPDLLIGDLDSVLKAIGVVPSLDHLAKVATSYDSDLSKLLGKPRETGLLPLVSTEGHVDLLLLLRVWVELLYAKSLLVHRHLVAMSEAEGLLRGAVVSLRVILEDSPIQWTIRSVWVFEHARAADVSFRAIFHLLLVVVVHGQLKSIDLVLRSSLLVAAEVGVVVVHRRAEHRVVVHLRVREANLAVPLEELALIVDWSLGTTCGPVATVRVTRSHASHESLVLRHLELGNRLCLEQKLIWVLTELVD